MSEPLFADTFYWIALTDTRDANHDVAVAITEEREASRIVTTDEVLCEYLAYFAGASMLMRRTAGEFAADLLVSPSIEVIPQSRRSFEAGLELFNARSDKDYSLVDCISMQAMRAEGIREALTHDHHFEQEGFRALFRS